MSEGDFRSVGCPALRPAALPSLRQPGRLQCMQHPLGFYHVRLFQQGPVTLRLHYWPAKRRPSPTAVTPYHDHVWALQSCVIVGTIGNVELSLRPDDTAPYMIATIEQLNGIDMVVPTAERVAIASTERSLQSCGQSYSISPRIFHCTEVALDVAAITIVRAEVVVSGGPRTLVPVGYSGQAPTRAYLPESDADIVLAEVEGLLSEGAAGAGPPMPRHS